MKISEGLFLLLHTARYYQFLNQKTAVVLYQYCFTYNSSKVAISLLT